MSVIFALNMHIYAYAELVIYLAIHAEGWCGKIHSIFGSRILVTSSLENDPAVCCVIDVDIDNLENRRWS